MNEQVDKSNMPTVLSDDLSICFYFGCNKAPIHTTLFNFLPHFQCGHFQLYFNLLSSLINFLHDLHFILIRQYSGFKTDYAKELHADDVKICANFSVDQIQNAFHHLKNAADCIGVYGLLMRQVRLIWLSDCGQACGCASTDR